MDIAEKNVINKIGITATAAVLIIAATFIYGCSKQETAGGVFEMPPMPVEVAESKIQKVADKFDAVGDIDAIESVTLVSEIDASIMQLPFQEGTYVKKGELIAKLDDSQLAAELTRSEALYDQSKASYNRIKKIVDQNAGTPQDLDDAAASLKVAEANLALAKARFAKTRITAPFDGMAGARKVSVGTFVRTGQPITELANLNEIRVNFSSPERYLAQLKRGSEVSISTTAYPGHNVSGKIIVIEPVLDPETRSVQVVAAVPNPGQKFLPGMSANISAVLTERPEAVTIPTEAVFANGNQSFVFVVNKDGTVAQTPIKLGLQLADVVEVTEGLKPGTQVVRAGHQKLFPGAKVMPVNSQSASAK